MTEHRCYYPFSQRMAKQLTAWLLCPACFDLPLAFSQPQPRFHWCALVNKSERREDAVDISLRMVRSPPRDFKAGFEVGQETRTELRARSSVLQRRVIKSPLLVTTQLSNRVWLPLEHLWFTSTDTGGEMWKATEQWKLQYCTCCCRCVLYQLDKGKI